MWIWLLLPLVFAGGYFLGWWQNKRWRYQRIIIARLRFQAIALSVETLSLRNKVVSQGSCKTPPANRKLVRKRPSIAFWKRKLIAWLRLKWPWLTKFMRFSPMTYINWHKAKARAKHDDKILAGIAKAVGRPATPQFIVDAILAIKRDNLRYSAGHIARMISGGELKFRISKKTVAKILKDNGFKPKPKGKRPPREEEPGWVETIYNQHWMAIDTKKIYDLAGNALYIFNIIDHGRRVLHWSRATYNPNAEWLAQQLRNAFMDLDTLPEVILMDRDTSFLPLVKHTIPNMGIKVVRTPYKCPWHNAVVERFHRTLEEDLLRYVVPHDEFHLNRLLTQYREYYNTVRPHMKNNGESPIAADVTNLAAVNDPSFFKTPRKLVRKKWLGGLHASYRWAA